MDTKTVRSLDKSDMLKLLSGFPGQLKEALAIGKKISFDKDVKRDFNKIVFCGLGGSAIGADLIRSYVAKVCRLPIIVNRDYTLPAFVDDKTLLIVSSYSGNTEETLSAYDEGRKRGANIVAITTNGKLKENTQKDKVPCIMIPAGLPPRCALGYSSIPVLVLLSKLGVISDNENEIEKTSDLLAELYKAELAPDIDPGKNISKRIARELFGKYAIIYGANQHTDCAATRWRGQLAENSKAISSTHLFPEMNHNEIVGWANPKDLMKDLAVVILRDKGDHPRVAKRMDISASIINKVGTKIIEISSRGDSLLGRIFSLIYIGDFVSFYLAILNDVDPTPVDSVMYLKSELAKIG
ncbi:MAG: bifunctional phosphoglucose/phosphomannose isomerase [Candidatus Omnitrophota bacterium]